MARQNNSKPYRFIEAAGRNIQCVFSHIPGKRFSTGTTDRDLAVLWAEDFLRTDGYSARQEMTFGEFAKDFFIRTDPDSLYGRNLGNGRKYGPEWGPGNQKRLEYYILPKFEHYLLASITAPMVENWSAGLRIRGSNKRMANSTKAGVISTFSLVMDDALRKGYIQHNVVRLALQPKVDRNHSNKRSMTAYEEKLFMPDSVTQRIVVWENVRDAAMFSIMHDTGFRPNEVCGLRVEDLYVSPGGMAVCTSHTINGMTRKPVDKVKTSGKGAENRVGLLSPVTEELVKMHLAINHIEEGWMFLNLRGGFQAPADAWKRSKEIFIKNGSPDLTQYCFRHTFITWRKGEMDETMLALTAGHMNGTRETYDHRNAAILINQLEKNRGDIFREHEEPDIAPYKVRKA